MSRRTIRDAVKALIETDLAGVANEVSIGRRSRLPQANLPACSVFTDSEEIEAVDLGPSPRTLERKLDLVIRIFVREGMDFSWDDLSTWLDGNVFFTGGGDLVDDHLDAIAYVIEDAISASGNLGIDWVRDIVLTGWEVDGEEEDSDGRYLNGDLTFTVTYHSTEVV